MDAGVSMYEDGCYDAYMPQGMGGLGMRREGNRAHVSRWLYRGKAKKLKQRTVIEPFSSDLQKSYSSVSDLSVVEEEDKVLPVVMTGGIQSHGQPRSTVSQDAGMETVEAEKILNKRGKGRGKLLSCSSCFGRAISRTRWFPTESSLLLCHGSSGTSPPDSKYKKGQRSLRKFSCGSSRDVLPSIIPTQNHLHGRHNSVLQSSHQGTEALLGGENGRSMIGSSAVCHYELGGGSSGHDEVNSSLTRAPSMAFQSGKRGLMKPTVVHSESTSSNCGFQGCHDVAREEDDQEVSRFTLDSETSPPRSSVDDQSCTQGESSRSSGFVVEDTQRLNSDRSTTVGLRMDSGFSNNSLQNLPDASFSFSPAQSSISQAPRVSSMSGGSHRTRSLYSSPSSYMSSPDVHFRNFDVLRSYANTFRSPSSNRATVSSPDYEDGYHLETPVYRPFRHFPMRRFDSEECFSFEGFSEQVYMLEANLYLGGLSSHDQHQDLRLDIDGMSYEDLLALEESIGNVCTGLEKDTILRCLKSSSFSLKYPSATRRVEEVELKCSVCQEDYMEGIQLGTLNCGHIYHFSCIEQWLMQKNQCPICKASAVS